MTEPGFHVAGVRPQSASSHQQQNVISKHGYHVLSSQSAVDELLFGSQRATNLIEIRNSFKAPWEYPKPASPTSKLSAGTHHKADQKPKPQARPLLWCPPPGTITHPWKKNKAQTSVDDKQYLWSTRDHFRQVKHTPSFTDESLFGSKLAERSFQAPWGVRNSSNFTRPTLGDSAHTKFSAGKNCSDPINSDLHVIVTRPASALGLSGRKVMSHSTSEAVKPVWKP